MPKVSIYLKVGFILLWAGVLVWTIMTRSSDSSDKPSFGAENSVALTEALNSFCKEISSLAKCSEIVIGGKSEPIASARLLAVSGSAVVSCDAINDVIMRMAASTATGEFHRLRFGEELIAIKCDIAPSGDRKLIGLLRGK